MKNTLAVGLTKTRRIAIDKQRVIDFMGEELRVYATPWMARDIEVTCRDLIFENLDDGEDTVGARIVDVPRELLGLHTDVNGLRFGWRI